QELAGRFDLIALAELDIFAEDDDADGILFEIEGQAADTRARELEHLAGHRAAESVDAGDAVAHLEHAADLADGRARLLPADFLSQYGNDLVGFESHERCSRTIGSGCR